MRKIQTEPPGEPGIKRRLPVVFIFRKDHVALKRESTFSKDENNMRARIRNKYYFAIVLGWTISEESFNIGKRDKEKG